LAKATIFLSKYLAFLSQLLMIS